MNSFLDTTMKTKAERMAQTDLPRFEISAAPTKSPSDKKQYKVIRLKNGLTACLIADIPKQDEINNEFSSNFQTAAASLTIGVGSFSDPKSIPGMAHFLEHMVFMGSQKYPDENDFSAFISTRGGVCDAITHCEATTFYFQCPEKNFAEGLDKFAQFFIEPLIKKDSVEREREAVDSEFKMGLMSDTNRETQLLLSFAKEDLPLNMFGWGNMSTLKDAVTEDELYEGLHEFRKRHYSAHRMTLAIQGTFSIDVLEQYVLQCFGEVPTNSLPSNNFTELTDPFDTLQFRKIYYIESINAMNQVNLNWVLPSTSCKYTSKPDCYVAWVLGHEGKGSLLSYLKQKVWVLSLIAGVDSYIGSSTNNSIYAFFNVSINLTSEGLDHLNEVIEAVFSYINMLRELGPQEHIFKEIKAIDDTSFTFSCQVDPLEIVTELSHVMQIYPPENYLTYKLFFGYDPEAIQILLDTLLPQKVNIIARYGELPQGLNYDKSEKWFGTKYTEQDIPKGWLQRWRDVGPCAEFALPPVNQFLTQDFTVLADEQDHPDYPQKLVHTQLVEIWYRKDQKFKLPYANYYLYLISPMAVKTALNVTMMDFYVNLLQILMKEEIYPAEMADLSNAFTCDDKGITIAISGYNEKLYLVLEVVTKYIVHFNTYLTEEIFDAVRDKITSFYYNTLLDPMGLLLDTRLMLLIDNYYSSAAKFNAAYLVTFENIKQFAIDFSRTLYVKALVQGNVTKDQAINVINNFITALSYNEIYPTTYPKFRVAQIPNGETFCIMESLNKADPNSVVTNYYQVGPFSIKKCTIIDILMMIIENPLFDTLRTKEQLGYHVSCSNRKTYNILGFSITVCAAKNSTQYVSSRIDEFVNQTTPLLTSMSLQEFEKLKDDFIKLKLCPDANLTQESNRNWSEITDDDYMFDRTERQVEVIKQLEHSDVRNWWMEYICSGNNLKKISFQVVGYNKSEQAKHIGDINENATLSINFLDNEIKGSQQHSCIKNIRNFQNSLFLFPAIIDNCDDGKKYFFGTDFN